MESGSRSSFSRMTTILIVEDEFLVRLGIVDVLEETGFVALEASSAAEALGILSAEQDVAATVLDIGLPDRRGDDLARALRKARPAMPVVIASGHVEAALQQAFAGDPLVRFLGKPYDDSDLIALLGKLGVATPG